MTRRKAKQPVSEKADSNANMPEPSNLDAAFSRMEKLFADVSPRLDEIETEADARLQLINRILVEILGWDFSDLKTEVHNDSGYTDYLISVAGRGALVIEAKRTGKLLLATQKADMGAYKVSGPAFRPIQDGFKQAAGYCLEHGVDFGCVTTGITWIAFQPFPAGLPYKEGNAIVFPGISAILKNFAEFHDLFSKEGVSARTYKIHFSKAHGASVRDFQPMTAVMKSEEFKIIPRSNLATDLYPLFREFFGTLTGDSDKEMLLECFVETPESRRADATLEKIIRNISSDVETIAASAGTQLTREIATAVESKRGESIVIVSNKGAGKSTFTKRFFDLVLESSIRSKCLVITVDLLASSGNVNSIAGWLESQVRNEIERQLFASGIPTYDELQGLYWKEYQGWRDGPFKPLYETDRNSFKIKFGEYLNEVINKDMHGYILRLLKDTIDNRKLLPCVVFDNADHHSVAFQEAVFQWAQSLRVSVPLSLIFIPVTDRTIWRLSKAGPFQTYPSKIFYLPVPSTKEVLDRRIEYIKKKSSNEKNPKTYYLSKGITLSIENINAFAACAEEIFINQDYVSRRISWLANHDIRRGLLLTQQIMTSPHFSIDDLVAAYLKRQALNTVLNFSTFGRALILGEYNAFNQSESDFILNVFEPDQEFISSPLLMLSILKFLIDKAGQEGLSGSYVTLNQLLTYLDAMGIEEEPSRKSIELMLSYRLVDPYDASVDTLATEPRLAISHSGRMHYEMATTDPIYVAQMALTTPMRDSSSVERMRILAGQRLDSQGWKELRRTFLIYCIAQDRIFARVPGDKIYAGQAQLRKDLQRKWVVHRRAPKENLVDVTLPEEIMPGATGRTNVSAKVVFYNSSKGYGFLEGDGNVGDVFLHKSVLEEAGCQELDPGDFIVGDVGAGLKGRFQFTRIHNIQRASSEQTEKSFEDGTVDFYNASRGFCFAHVPSLGSDVYISAKVVAKAGITSLVSGERLKVLVSPLIGRDSKFKFSATEIKRA